MRRSSPCERLDGANPTLVATRREKRCLSKSQSCFNFHEGNTSTSTCSMELEASHLFLDKERLLLPRRGSTPILSIDEYLSSIPRVVSRAHELYMEKDGVGAGRCVNVLQGEVAHVSAEHADVVVSAEATTCHIVALRSTKSESTPLVSLAHVDQAYDDCLENMVKEHLEHHEKQYTLKDDTFGFFMDGNDEENNLVETEIPLEQVSGFLPGLGFDKRSVSMPVLDEPKEQIEMELHMVGGFLDKDGTSQQLSNSLVQTFNDLADKYRGRLKISLSTAAISCMNNEKDAPRSRGLGIDTRTGKVFALKNSLPVHLEGPAVDIRSARAFCESNRTLSVIHGKAGQIRIDPFLYQQNENLNVLLGVSDEVLLNITSTSPQQESNAFCTNFRRTLSFVNTTPPETVFQGNKPLFYSRSSTNLNEWEVSCEAAPSF